MIPFLRRDGNGHVTKEVLKEVTKDVTKDPLTKDPLPKDVTKDPLTKECQLWKQVTKLALSPG